MTALDHLIVRAAVAVSPAAHRDTRREQWLADVRDARELDLSPTALAFGALTTALFHRRAAHRTTWGESMTAAPIHVRTTPHTIRTVPVLVAVAITSLVMAGGWLIVQPNYGYSSETDQVLGSIGTWSLVFVVPGVSLALAALVLHTSTARRRIGASTILAATATAIVYPFVSGPVALPLSVLPMLLGLAGWYVAARTPAWTWALAAVPVVVWYLSWNGVLYQLVPVRWSPFLIGAPDLALVLIGIIATRFSTDARTRVESHREALVDKSA